MDSALSRRPSSVLAVLATAASLFTLSSCHVPVVQVGSSGQVTQDGLATDSMDPDERYALVAPFIERSDFERLPSRFQDRLVFAVQNRDVEMGGLAACYFGFMPAEFSAAIDLILGGGPSNPLAFQVSNNRWVSTANNPGPIGQGDPMILTYSFMPDGVFIPSQGIGAGANNTFRATFDGIFGSQANWLPLFQQAFDDWGELTGVQYVYEPNDDGAVAFTSPGVVGVRGDVRIGGRPIDGSSGTIAFNFFPNGGSDMTFDVNDTGLYGNPGGNFRLLRNVIMHEHGHGLGLAHTCPVQQTKLMEPFVSGAFDGAQFDDFLGANRQNGDRNEPNDNRITATDLGTFGVGSSTLNNLTIDDDADEDWFSFNVNGFNTIAIDVGPIGTPYVQGPQFPDCGDPNFPVFDPRVVHDLGFELLAPDGTTRIALVDSLGLGGTESLASTDLVSGPGTYFVRVFGGSTNNVQGYSVEFDVGTFPPPATIALPFGAPASLVPGAETLLDFETQDSGVPFNPTTGQLFASVNGAPFTATPLREIATDRYQGVLPAAECMDEVRWYATIELANGVMISQPPLAPVGTNVTSAGDAVFADDFESNQGWTITNTPSLTDGAWSRGVPVNGGRGDPPVDADGSGSAFVTDNVAGNSDVDGGQTILTSPSIDLTGVPEALVRFQFWYDNEEGASPNQDTFLIEIDSGSGFQLVETYNGNANAWLQREFVVTGGPSNLRVRFTAQDADPGSVVEAGVDDFVVMVCEDPAMLDVSCAGGNVGAAGEDIFTLSGSSGGAARRLVANVDQQIVLEMALPSSSAGSAPFAAFFQEGTPGPLDLTPIAGVGTLCIGAPGLALGPFVSGVAAPFSAVTAGLSSALEVTLQGVILESAGTVRITNAITLEVR